MFMLSKFSIQELTSADSLSSLSLVYSGTVLLRLIFLALLGIFLRFFLVLSFLLVLDLILLFRSTPKSNLILLFLRFLFFLAFLLFSPFSSVHLIIQSSFSYFTLVSLLFLLF